MKRQLGMSLIELSIFIVIVGIMASGALVTFKNVLNNNNTPGADFQAAQLADARMNIIIMQRLVAGFSGISDPCASGALTACTDLSAYASSVGLSASSSIGAVSSGTRKVTVTVSGTGQATIAVEFVQ